TPLAPTAPVMPIVATALVQPRHAQLISITNGSASSIANFNKNGIVIAPGISATLDGNGFVATNRLSNAPLCNIPNGYATANYQVALGTYGMVLGLNRTVHAWADCVASNPYAPTDITNSIPTAFQTNVAEIAVRGTHMLILTLDGRIWSNQLNIPQMANIKHIAAGRNFAAVLLGNGTIQVIANSNADGVKNIPTNAVNITDIAAGDYHIIALNNNGQVYSWGANQHDNGQADVPYAATQGNVIAISAGEQQSIVMLNNGNAVAWGDYPANTIDALDDVNRLHHVSGIATGDRQIALLIDDTLDATITPIPSVTPLVVPTMTPRANDAQFIANQIAWFTMADFSQPQTFNGYPQTGNLVTFSCGSPRACPTLNTSDFPTLAFNNSRNTELIASNAINLNGVPFTIRARMRRDSLNRADVAASIGKTGVIRQYLAMGVDKENRPYCSFYGDDLRSTSWYVDQEWHNYACSYDPTSRIRTLWRDAQIIGQDIVRGAFTPPAAPLIIGRRYDNMSGLTGSIQQLDIINHVLSQTEQTYPDTVTDLQKISGLVFDTQLQSIAPNKSTTRCGSNGIICPIWGTATIQEPSHDGAMAIFTGNQRLQIDKPVTPNGFSIGYWARSIRADYGQTIVSHLNSNGTGMRMGNYYNNGNFLTGCTWTTMQYGEQGYFEITASIDDQNLWHHYLCSFDAVNGRLAYYVDGVLITQYNAVYTQTITAPVVVGYTPAGFPNFSEGYYTGWLDDLMIYDSAVSQTGVAYIYNSTNPPT
ncbi:MAG: hypothetical protein EBS29_10025, partial [Chloroflexia bacterium]|nr:hypothetical protein [Chloroflexia bacterium]